MEELVNLLQLYSNEEEMNLINGHWFHLVDRQKEVFCSIMNKNERLIKILSASSFSGWFLVRNRSLWGATRTFRSRLARLLFRSRRFSGSLFCCYWLLNRLTRFGVTIVVLCFSRSCCRKELSVNIRKDSSSHNHSLK